MKLEAAAPSIDTPAAESKVRDPPASTSTPPELAVNAIASALVPCVFVTVIVSLVP